MKNGNIQISDFNLSVIQFILYLDHHLNNRQVFHQYLNGDLKSGPKVPSVLSSLLLVLISVNLPPQ